MDSGAIQPNQTRRGNLPSRWQEFRWDNRKQSQKRAAGKPAARGFSPHRDQQLKEGFPMGRDDQRPGVPEPWPR